MAVAMERRFLSAEEVGEQLGLKRSRVYELAAGGHLPVVRLGKRVLFPRRGLEELERAAAGTDQRAVALTNGEGRPWQGGLVAFLKGKNLEPLQSYRTPLPARPLRRPLHRQADMAPQTLARCPRARSPEPVVALIPAGGIRCSSCGRFVAFNDVLGNDYRRRLSYCVQCALRLDARRSP